ncbi:MAG: tRNA (adenosine(37)-N6)-dimethylallyltransferase MiaA [Lentimicrobiaceae bacterium]|nr:tRNA (adenosine(37)-N6)-dimethylallyltransferase MiaA [Lentimicrobiaceae bacterium]
MMNNKLLVVVTGPTAVGKTSLSIELAKHFNTVIISADSRQFYKQLNIAVAKPDQNQLKEVEHHFINVLDIADYYNVAQFETDVLQKLDEIFAEKDIAFLVGGSGLYIDAVCYGIDYFPDVPDDLRNSLNNIFEQKGIEELRRILKEKDPEYYNVVDKDNPQRLLRAIEVCLITGKPFSEQRLNEPKKRNFNIIKIALNMDRAVLNERISVRVDEMLDAGLIDEAKELYKYKELNSLKTVGYREFFDYFESKYTIEEAVEKIKTNTRRYAKRQVTWLKKDESYKWFSPEQKEVIIDHIKSNM